MPLSVFFHHRSQVIQSHVEIGFVCLRHFTQITARMLAKDTHGRAQTRTHGKQPQPSIETEPIQCNRDRLPPMLVTLATSYMATGEPRELYRRRCAKTSRLKSEAAAGIPPKPKSLAFVSICCSMHSTESFTKHRP